MNKSTLIALCLAASGLLAGCVNPGDPSSVVAPTSTAKAPTNHA